MIFFELHGDEGDKDRVKLNLIQLAEEQETLERTETEKEIRFKGIIKISNFSPIIVGKILDNQDYNKRNYSENPPCLDGGNHSQASVNMHGSNNEQVEMVKHSPDAKDKKGLDIIKRGKK